MYEASFYEVGHEINYHNYLLGMCSAIDTHHVSSNQISGYGLDIELQPKNDKTHCRILIGLKAVKEEKDF